MPSPERGEGGGEEGWMAGHETKFIDCSYIMSVCIVYVCLWGVAWYEAMCVWFYSYVCGWRGLY